MKKTAKPPFYGIMAEFMSSDALVRAAKRTYDAGYRKIDAYSPFPVEHLAEAMGFTRTRLPLIVLIGALLGCVGGYFLQYWVSVIDYPLNIGGRPFHSWPSFIPVTFECTILSAALFTVLGMLALNGLPEPYHPVFNVTEFEHASRDRFYLVIQADDRKFDEAAARQFLQGLGPQQVFTVEH